MKAINLNRNIYFRLTEKGKELLKDPYFSACVKPVNENGDLFTTQFWVFCGLFGNGMQYPSFSIDVETEVYFKDCDLSNRVSE